LAAAVVYLGLGANLGDRRANLRRALTLLEERGVQIDAASALYETPPWGVEDQPAFLNAVVRATTSLPPAALLEACKAVERAAGRVPGTRWGPRAVDLDILFFGELRVDEAELQIPHPRILDRAFVLVPLMDVLEAEMPVLGARPSDVTVDRSGIKQVEGPGWWK
jgi:2-amino-4-hydroxy-6-hydroxymethyldihydropteridine diphosphokinase